MKYSPSRGSHLPVLMRLFNKTLGEENIENHGRILELGCGMYSTPYLHWACYDSKRPLVTYEDNPQWLDFAKSFSNDYHKIVVVDDWDKVVFPECCIALIDHNPVKRENRSDRSREVARLTHADYVVCHDAENINDWKYRFTKNHKLFKFRWKYTGGGYPLTAVFSNKWNVKGIL
jgi:hypothetical protein